MSSTTTSTPAVLATAHLGRLASALGDTEPATAEPPDLTQRQFDAALARDLPGVMVYATGTTSRSSSGKWTNDVRASACLTEDGRIKSYWADSWAHLMQKLRADFGK